ncbi:hypothetical protein OO013_01305 [Mangrovivirga sp. M17]|uniref:Uncharacterized protein n=1 Tax=Mangrovivirga halotolerans TaxID=2993936 RepID=A0ABT3RKX0_9BACT|nr:hypothetical protein [Mangrovivirga halotolerans]MCX2742478.1 hypothetical protein [Mangrovivirga halotolerans]
MKNLYKTFAIAAIAALTFACETENVEPQIPVEDEKADVVRRGEDIRGDVVRRGEDIRG